MQAFNDNNVSFVVRGGLQVLVILADPNAGTLRFHVHYFPFSQTPNIILFFNDDCMLLIYFQWLGLIANDSTATAAETGAFMKHPPAAFLLGILWSLCLFLSWFPNKSESYPDWACPCRAVLFHLILLQWILNACYLSRWRLSAKL